MIYLDYSATTKPDEEVLKTFNKVAEDYFANPNSTHKLGIESKKLIEQATEQIKKLLHLKEKKVIYTSGATEANNMALKGIVENKNIKRILTTKLEHPSIFAPSNYLNKSGVEVIFLKTNESGEVDLDNLSNLLNDEKTLVTICAVNSEIGIKQPIEKIAKQIKKYPNTHMHTDATQAIGKVNIDYKDVDMISFTAHKIYGIKGIGALLINEDYIIEPLIHGGHSTTIYRAGTPTTELIVSFSKALRIALEKLNDNYKIVLELNNHLKEQIKEYCQINSTTASIPHILNISVENHKPETLQRKLEENEIYISTKTACGTKGGYSMPVYEITNDMNRAKTSIRISISHKTTKKEIDTFIKHFKEAIK